MMDPTTGEVVETVVIPVTDVANSNAMEKAGFVKVVLDLQNEGINIHTISTDRHIQIRKLMRTDPRFKGKKSFSFFFSSNVLHINLETHNRKIKTILLTTLRQTHCEKKTNYKLYLQP